MGGAVGHSTAKRFFPLDTLTSCEHLILLNVQVDLFTIDHAGY
jgi:hypothetical protein